MKYNKLSSDKSVQYHMDNTTIESVTPAWGDFGFLYFYLMVPPYKPVSVLILGYAQGTIGELIKRIWGDDIPITGVDLKAVNKDVIEMDGFDFVANAVTNYDFIVVDMFKGQYIDERVYSPDFLKNLAGIGRMVAINLWHDPKEADVFKDYFDVLFKKNQRGNTVYFLKPSARSLQEQLREEVNSLYT